MTDDKIITFEKARNSAKHQPSVLKQKDRKLEKMKAAFKASRDEVRKRNKKKRDGKKGKK